MSDFKNGHNFFGLQQQQEEETMEASSTNVFSPSDPFQENEFRSFSDLLAGALSGENNNNSNNTSLSCGFNYKQNRPGSLALPPVAPVFNISPTFSPSAFLNSPTFLSSLGMSPQQTLAHITAQAALSHVQVQVQAHNHHQHHNNLSIQNDTLHSSSIPTPATPNFLPSMYNTSVSRHPNVLEHSNLERKPPQQHHQHNSHNFPIAVDKPADDGYNWRKYGQKQVKGSEYPRSYYRCTSPNCPVKKKVERSFDGHITEIIYKGQHNHDRPQAGRRGNKDNNNNEGQFGNSMWLGGVGRDHYDSAQAISMHLHGPSDSEESGENSQLVDVDDDYNDHNPKPKRSRNHGGGQSSEGGFTHRTMTEPKIVVQTRSDIDLLDDGYRWRKYGQKVVKGNPNPRSYYKCTTVGCKVRKHVERASTDASAVITTYEGKHNHDVPASRGGATSINTAAVVVANVETTHMSFGSNHQSPIPLRLKEEQLVT